MIPKHKQNTQKSYRLEHWKPKIYQILDQLIMIQKLIQKTTDFLSHMQDSTISKNSYTTFLERGKRDKQINFQD
jgi:hypothetical protein